MNITLRVNGKDRQLDVDPEMPLLWALRDVLGLTGTKYGCGQALCGACTVHLNGQVIRSCVTPVRRAANAEIVTIEGLARREPSAAEGVGGAGGAAVRLLPGRAVDDGRRAPEEAPAAKRRADRSVDGRQSVSVRHVQPNP
jgi:hypothetical protein